jgi:hypothetical protein
MSPRISSVVAFLDTRDVKTSFQPPDSKPGWHRRARIFESQVQGLSLETCLTVWNRLVRRIDFWCQLVCLRSTFLPRGPGTKCGFWHGHTSAGSFDWPMCMEQVALGSAVYLCANESTRVGRQLASFISATTLKFCQSTSELRRDPAKYLQSAPQRATVSFFFSYAICFCSPIPAS